jgi:hypothetical protein
VFYSLGAGLSKHNEPNGAYGAYDPISGRNGGGHYTTDHTQANKKMYACFRTDCLTPGTASYKKVALTKSGSLNLHRELKAFLDTKAGRANRATINA